MYPRILLLVGEPEMIALAGHILRDVSWERGMGKQCMGYDTQFEVMWNVNKPQKAFFEVGPYYVSTLTMRDPRRVNRDSGAVCILSTFMVSTISA